MSTTDSESERSSADEDNWVDDSNYEKEIGKWEYTSAENVGVVEGDVERILLKRAKTLISEVERRGLSECHALPSTSLDSFIAVQERTMGEVALLLACFLSKGDYLEPLKSRLQGGLRAQDKDLLVEHELYGLLEAICLAAVHEKPISAIFSKEMEAHVGTLPRLPQARILELLGALDCREVSVIDRNSSSSTSFETPLPTSCQLSTYLEACKKCSRTWSRIFFVRNGSVITTDDDKLPKHCNPENFLDLGLQVKFQKSGRKGISICFCLEFSTLFSFLKFFLHVNFRCQNMPPCLHGKCFELLLFNSLPLY